MRALTIRQPWASLLVAGIKYYEGRTRAPPKKLLGERIAIHAGKAIDSTPLAQEGIRLLEYRGIKAPKGAIIATAVLARAYRGHPCLDRWTDDSYPWMWRFQHFAPVAPPAPCRGQLGFWTVPISISIFRTTA